MNTQNWKLVKKLSSRRKLGTVWLVRRSKAEQIETGYFKFSTPQSERYIGPLSGNELLAYQLASRLNLPSARVEAARIEGQLGVVSLARAEHQLYKWTQMNKQIHHNIEKFVICPDRLVKMFVFDIWICNIDRHGKNLIVYPVGKKYDFYLIDHGLSLLGAMQWQGFSWDHPHWDTVLGYNLNYVRGLSKYIRNYEQLDPYVKEIQHIPDHELEALVDSVPPIILSHENKKTVKLLLLSRQKKLHTIVQRWVKHYKRNPEV
ncbi:hypothetical protein PP175_13610 [Aneurinibacillus sp. Ricciae_BoGa-3]|uniref:HipA family kinase n=1 Tax=Aneurinibacillus sp. Ricciae_BoGa-3 TaxID=3022697 RepID=UPI002342498E|nr:HipA family kinase [Aneurinibacillus sp. Ricciae_BoGa-3]WCK52492.1 hypothetical protein PP175_13610 [Aneurinibacillus sp. Ricciae_BoGa-3]